MQLTEENLREHVEVFAVALSSSQDNPQQQTPEVLEAVASYFNQVTALVEGIVNSGSENSTISPVVSTWY